jgi:hypothetical protein
MFYFESFQLALQPTSSFLFSCHYSMNELWHQPLPGLPAPHLSQVSVTLFFFFFCGTRV